jgi:hypothetical protein
MELGEENITEKDVIGVMDVFTRVPAMVLKMVVSKNMNVVKTFESQIEEYKSQLSGEDLVKIQKVLKMPVPELQEILNNAYAETGHKQLKILGDPGAELFITENFQELRTRVFK